MQRSFAVLKNDVLLLTVPVAIMLQNQPEQGELKNVQIKRKFKGLRAAKMREPKPSLINQQCALYNYQCDLCDAEYVGSILASVHLHHVAY